MMSKYDIKSRPLFSTDASEHSAGVGYDVIMLAIIITASKRRIM